MNSNGRRKVFVSYSHQQGEWVFDRLMPVLEAGGLEVLVDRERFTAGKAVFKQMDDLQDQGDQTILVISPDYLASTACKHEMDRAIAGDPDFKHGKVIPIKRVECVMPPEIHVPDPLYVDLREDNQHAPWETLLKSFEVVFGVEVPHWLKIRDELVGMLNNQTSVNLVVTGNPRWKELLKHIEQVKIKDLATVDLNDLTTSTRRGLVEQILLKAGVHGQMRDGQELVELAKHLKARHGFKLALKHFDRVIQRLDYGVDLYGGLRHLMENRHLTLIIQSRESFSMMAKTHDPLCSFVDIKEIRLQGKMP